ncbi:MAG: DUF523 and DUF1722 domain-containing protein [Nitrospirota bacterium]|nr:MAG: DUF523 and DUF1722 domain-containing protein [Nitrospirota bacterium]
MIVLNIGISSCLIGKNVRYDGRHKRDHFLTETLGKFVTWIPVCPEVECGLPVPREAMRLVGTPDTPRLVTRTTKQDHTKRMTGWAKKKVRDLEAKDLCGFVFKSRSPSSGMERVKIYDINNRSVRMGKGIFAMAFMSAFPQIPVEDEGRLHDPDIRENFIERIFTFRRWKDLIAAGKTINGLIRFHSVHKYLIMAHSPEHLRKLGKMVAGAKKEQPSVLFDSYGSELMNALKLRSTVKKNTNVLQHMLGYFKKQLNADEKKELLDTISNYHKGLVPLIVPITLLNHYTLKYKEPYLRTQIYLHPHPVELMLRNHV